ncbi:metallophosphoesterase [Sphingomonas sp. BK235]|uniref:metallophosphoesterase n=1 Tax=Sphingomonas sp. BK235 TaxID=2512131 RepID=UPI0010483DA3|nr:metallophosphoesterase [Sphingomonas sp. BK235]TCP31823.1 serine/threonine protein phosphatase 1 [Sphingomonas sp. BK235]
MAVTALRHATHDAPAGVRPGARPLYAIGDVHGHYDQLRALLAWVAQDATERSPGALPVLVLCGDYVDRGPDTRRVLAALVWLTRSSAIDVRLLEGNHEAMLRQFLDRPASNAAWLDYGGIETLRSYGVAADARDDPAALRDALLDAMPVSHHQLLLGLAPMERVGGYVFAHAGVRPGVALRDQVRDDLLWIRGDFLDHPRPAEAVVVHGHSWTDDRPVILPQRIGIDTGVYETGVLTAIRLDEDVIEVVQAVGAPAP